MFSKELHSQPRQAAQLFGCHDLKQKGKISDVYIMFVWNPEN